jgi:hypothetical protein
MIDGKVFMPGTPAMTLPELLKQTEVELGTPVESMGLLVAKTAGLSQLEYSSRVWVKDDWKLLDTCFTDEMDERLDVGV